VREAVPGVFDVQATTTLEIEVAFGLKVVEEEAEEDFDF